MHATFQMVAKKKLKECSGQFIVLSKAHHSLNKHAYLWQGLAILKFICKKRWKNIRYPYMKHQFSHQAMRAKDIGATKILSTIRIVWYL